MKVSDILKTKGSAVITVRRDETVLDLSEKLRQERIGAAIVGMDGHTTARLRPCQRLSEIQLEADVLRDYTRVQR